MKKDDPDKSYQSEETKSTDIDVEADKSQLSEMTEVKHRRSRNLGYIICTFSVNLVLSTEFISSEICLK